MGYDYISHENIGISDKIPMKMDSVKMKIRLRRKNQQQKKISICVYLILFNFLQQNVQIDYIDFSLRFLQWNRVFWIYMFIYKCSIKCWSRLSVILNYIYIFFFPPFLEITELTVLWMDKFYSPKNSKNNIVTQIIP